MTFRSILNAAILLLSLWNNGDAEANRAGLSIALSPETMKAVVDKHNYYRMKEGAADMQQLSWSDTLAQMASYWASLCVWKHGRPPRPTSGLEHDQLGQNIAYNMNTDFGLPTTVQLYMGEKKDFDYESNTCKQGKTCTHYNQVVWANTTDVGCAISKCTPMKNFRDRRPVFYYVCYYAPGGNRVGYFPYKKGPACSQCNAGQKCVHDLCSDP